MTANDVYERSLALYDEISKTGLPDPNKTKDYFVRAPKLIDMFQKELYKVSNYMKRHEVSLSPILNMFGQTTQFDIKTFEGTDLIVECLKGGAKCFYFECDGDGTAYIEDYTSGWNILSTITLEQLESGFKAYKGVLTPTTGATKTRIRFSGNYFYRTINRALFDIPFTLAKIPTYTPWVPLALPSNAKEIVDVITEYPERQYAKDGLYKKEQQGNVIQLYVNYYFNGRMRVVYRPVPIDITSLTQALEIDDITSQAIAYGLARWFALSEQNTDVANACEKKFQELKALAVARTPATEEKITDIYMGSSWGW
jgi:hypothetical protein